MLQGMFYITSTGGDMRHSLVEELIPLLEQEVHSLADAQHRCHSLALREYKRRQAHRYHGLTRVVCHVQDWNWDHYLNPSNKNNSPKNTFPCIAVGTVQSEVRNGKVVGKTYRRKRAGQ